MTVRVRYIQEGREQESSIEKLLVYSGSASTRSMKYLIALTEIMIRKSIIGPSELQDLAESYQVHVKVLGFWIDDHDKENAIDTQATAIDHRATAIKVRRAIEGKVK